jgi:putative adhesin
MRSLAPLGAALLVGCSSSLEVLAPGADSGAVSVEGDAGPGPGTEGGTRAAFCAGTGSPIITASGEAGAQSACLGGLAQSAFRWALCTCDGLVSATSIATDSFDGTQGGYDASAAQNGGGLGTNGNLSAQGTLDIGGALWVSDATGMTVATASSQGELHVGGRVASGPSLTVAGDAYVLGDVAATGNLAIDGTLFQPAGDTATAGGTNTIGASSNASFTVPPACDCDPALLINVAAYVESYRTSNDDSAVGIDPSALQNVSADTTLSLPCGRIFFTSVGGPGAITLALSAGRTAVFIGGDLAPNGAFAIDLPASSEVDVFVEGGVVAGSSFMLGNAGSPAKARLWVGSSASVNLTSAATLAGNVYAPLSELVLGSGATTIYGSVLAERVSAQGALTIHYDESVLGEGASCGAPAGGACTSCHDCGNQACIGGVCGACTASSDCCPPLVCNAGTCVADLVP